MAMRRMFPQPDLFEAPPPRMVLAPAERTKLVDQLRVLLMEAMATPQPTPTPRIGRRRAMTKITPDHLARERLRLRTSVDGHAGHP